MKIYTKTGDKGETSLRWGERVAKDALRVEAYGTVDEANASVGLAISLLPPPGQHPVCDQMRTSLTRVQRELFDVGADLATPPNRDKGEQPKVAPGHVEQLEQEIDALTAELAPLRHFILPGGSPAAAAMHVGRTVARRAERLLVTLSKQDSLDPVLLQYLNRLSDYLFTCARAVNQALSVPDPIVEWKK